MTNVSLEHFKAVEKSKFEVVLEEQTTFLCLQKVSVHNLSEMYESFSLFFHGPREPFLPQQMYAMRHEQLGELVLFMVPVGESQEGFQYEVVFNRLLEK